jgi:chemotaxis protein methyltransferase CheR
VSLAPDIVAGVSRRLAEHAGLELPAWVVEARTQARIVETGLDPASYLELIATARGAAELAALVEAVRVGESSLFRHLPQIAALVQVVVPSLRAKTKRAVRVWSAGCATGEEPYTLAAVLSRALPNVQLSVIATDVSAEALARARDATYPADELRDVPDEWRDIFIVDGDTLHVHPTIANLVSFEQANLLDAIPPKSCDLVWCRNVLIYFSADARRRVVDRLIASLVPGGYLFVGYSETLRDIPQLETIRHGDCVFYAKPEKETTNPGVDAYRTPPHGTQLPQRLPSMSIPIAVDEEREHTAVGVPPPPSRPTPVPSRLSGTSSPGITLPSSGKSSPNLPKWAPSPGSASKSQPLPTMSSGKSSPNIPVQPAGKSSPNIPISPRSTPLPSTIVRVPLVGQPNAQQLASLIDLIATKPGTKRWLSRHGLAEDV